MSSGGERTHQPDFLTPYQKAILGTIGLHDLTFFSVEVRPLILLHWPKHAPRPIKQCRGSFSVSRAIQQRFFSKPYERPTAPLIQPEFVQNSMTIVKAAALQFWPF